VKAALAVAMTAAIISSPATALAQTGNEPYRPQFHYTPDRGWMNDPNGLVYYAGQWHLFHQYNPYGDKWGHMSWAHAVSTDLMHWQHLPVALDEADSVMIFSGSAVVDWNNTSGLGRNGQPPLVAVYTGHHPPIQDQRIAFSNDSGRTWTKVPDAVIDRHMADFRDPKVFWHDATHSWVMAVALPNEHEVSIYRSPDLKHWTHASDFGPRGAVGGQWECPDLFQMQIEDGGTDRAWVMLVNINPGGVAGGSGTQYFLGSFDGYRFVPDSVPETRWLDYGPDYYAAVTYNDAPSGRRVLLAWMSNWLYGQDVPTSPWRSAMTVPRQLELLRTLGGIRLTQRPARELATLYEGVRRRSGGSFESTARWLEQQGNLPPQLVVSFVFSDIGTTPPFRIDWSTGPNEFTRITIDPAAGRILVDRSHSGLTNFNRAFAGTYAAPLRIDYGRVEVQLIIDASSIEVLVNGGEISMTSLIFPTGPDHRLTISSDGSGPPVAVAIQALHSALQP
jgi:fructan beta-fructosidase